MFIPKKYGHSRIDKCPFCQKQAISRNNQGIPVCPNHKDRYLDGLKCLCGSTLEIKNGKFGVFFSCIRCANLNLKKALELNAIKPDTDGDEETLQKKAEDSKSRKEITVRSDDTRYFD